MRRLPRPPHVCCARAWSARTAPQLMHKLLVAERPRDISTLWPSAADGGAEAGKQAEALWVRLSKGEDPRPVEVRVEGQGRAVSVATACRRAGVARFSFAELCDNPLGKTPPLP